MGTPCDSVTRISRRSILKSLGSTSILGVGGVTARAGTETNKSTTSGDCDNSFSDDSERFCPFENKASFSAEAGMRFSYRLTTTKGIEKDNGQRVQSVTGQVEGKGVAHSLDEYNYAGEVTQCQVAGGGHAILNQTTPCSTVDATQLGRDCATGGNGTGFCEFNNSFSVEPTQNKDVSAVAGTTHNIQMNEGGRRVPVVEFTVSSNADGDDPTEYSYAGEVTHFAVEGPAKVNIAQSKPCGGRSTTSGG